MSPAVRVEGLGKSYRLGVTHAGSLRELANRTTLRLLRRPAPKCDPTLVSKHANRVDADGLFWALRDVSFELQSGEILGILGKNGAGKSTLLKILSRITCPTTGRVELHGRVASLLEVGTGFHPELTGRENVYLNGAILGMTRAEVRRKFDEILAFAELERFIDTPVKRYSSGMQVRLAFAVGAHLDPEILIVDEVLAVGDAEFQRKCLGKLEEFSTSGRTILFVSHNVSAIRRLCSRCLILSDGRTIVDGSPQTVIDEYLRTDSNQRAEIHWNDGISNAGVEDFVFLAVRLLNENQCPITFFHADDTLHLELRFRFRRSLRHCRVGFILNSADGNPICELYDTDESATMTVRDTGTFATTCRFPLSQLLPGRYTISLNAGIPNVRNLAFIERALTFDLHESSSRPVQLVGPRRGVIRVFAKWIGEELS